VAPSRRQRRPAESIEPIDTLTLSSWLAELCPDASEKSLGGFTIELAINADGRYVSFESDASPRPRRWNGRRDVFVRDLVAGTTTRVSVDTSGSDADQDSSFPVISADGRFVSFLSDASDLVVGDTNGFRDVFVRGPT
jgi:hypothetical protein